MALLTPDRYFSRISAIDIERDLLGCGLTHVLLDIDNTVRARDTGCVPRDVGMWLGRAREAGVSFCLLSNNWHADVYRFAGELEMPIVAKALKPLPPAFLAARRKIGGAAADTVVVGDQLATDVLGAHLTGMKAYMLQPLVEQDLPHTLLLRNVERAILGDRKPEPAINIAECEASRSAARRGQGSAPRRFGQGAFDQPGNAVADEITVCRTFMRRIAVLLQRMVRSGSQIVDRIEQRPVKVEYNQFGIHENQIYPAKVAFCRELS